MVNYMWIDIFSQLLYFICIPALQKLKWGLEPSHMCHRCSFICFKGCIEFLFSPTPLTIRLSTCYKVFSGLAALLKMTIYSKMQGNINLLCIYELSLFLWIIDVKCLHHSIPCSHLKESSAQLYTLVFIYFSVLK